MWKISKVKAPLLLFILVGGLLASLQHCKDLKFFTLEK